MSRLQLVRGSPPGQVSTVHAAFSATCSNSGLTRSKSATEEPTWIRKQPRSTADNAWDGSRYAGRARVFGMRNANLVIRLINGRRHRPNRTGEYTLRSQRPHPDDKAKFAGHISYCTSPSPPRRRASDQAGFSNHWSKRRIPRRYRISRKPF